MMMKFAITMILGLAVTAAFAADNCGMTSGCCKQQFYKASALGSKDAEFLAMANAMAAQAEGKKVACCKDGKAKSAKKAKKSTKVAMAAKSCCAK
jgi:hypothetical protein